MKTTKRESPARSYRRGMLQCGSALLSWLFFSCALGLIALPAARAELSAPDNIVYGTIVLGSSHVTGADTAVTVEARTPEGLTLARYRMGELPQAAEFYKLTLKVEEITPRKDPVAALPGQWLQIVVISNGVTRAQQNFRLTERGQVARVDFSGGFTPTITGYKAWAAAYGLDPTALGSDVDGDGNSSLQEYIAGTDPRDPSSRFTLWANPGVSNTIVGFQARQARGIAYEGMSRHYGFEQRKSLSDKWEAVPNYSNMLGLNQTIWCEVPTTNALLLLRGRVWLEPDPVQGE